MGRNRIPSGDDDTAVWQSVTADITPLKGRRPPREAAAKPVKASAQSGPDAPAEPKGGAGAPPVPPFLSSGHTPGIDRRTAERLRRGQIAIDARLDLHGRTRAEAHHALAERVAESWETGRRVLLVITGKGQGILRDAVPRWLNEGTNRRRILMYCRAQPKHGGDGALYVLLKRRR